MKDRIKSGLAALLLLAAVGTAPAQAAELKVVCAGAMRAVVQALAPAFEKETGNKLSVQFATAGKVEEAVAADQPVDVAILTKPRADKLVRTAKLAGGSIANLAQVQIGLAVKKGAPHPDIGSVDAFKQALLKAKSIAYIDPASGGTSGIHLAQVLEKLGIANELKPKMHLVAPPPGQNSARAGELVERGEADIAMQPISELQEVAGIDVVGPLPAQLQTPDLSFVAGVPNISAQPGAAKAFVDFLAGPAAKATYKQKGMEPAGGGG